MTVRRIQTYEECLKSLTRDFKKQVKEDLKVWGRLDPKQAAGRRMAYANVLFSLKREAEAAGVPLIDLGLVDYEVPELKDYTR
jgi:hypothetical protein